MQEGFDTILIEGLFYKDAEGCLKARSFDGTETSVEEILKRFRGREIQLAMHHLPNIPLVPDRWGGGCCMWQASGKCPAGHHEDPSFLLSVAGRGVLDCPDGWQLVTFEGEVVSIPLHQMEGHYGRIAAVTIVDLEKLRESLAKTVGMDRVEAIGVQASQLQAMLGQLHSALRGMK